MFTGIVEEVGRVRSLEAGHGQNGTGRLVVGAGKVLVDTRLGDSIAVNGACLTVVALDNGSFSVDLAPETLRRTNLGSLAPGSGVNLERPLTLADRLRGHLVQGHVDGRGRLTSTKPEGDCVLMSFRAPKRLMRYIVEKGFIALDGISLTIVRRGASSFAISVIPYSLENTTLKERYVGDTANLEVDMLAKYVESLLRPERYVISDLSPGD